MACLCRSRCCSAVSGVVSGAGCRVRDRVVRCRLVLRLGGLALFVVVLLGVKCSHIGRVFCLDRSSASRMLFSKAGW